MLALPVLIIRGLLNAYSETISKRQNILLELALDSWKINNKRIDQ